MLFVKSDKCSSIFVQAAVATAILILLFAVTSACASEISENPVNLYVNGINIMEPGSESAVPGVSYDKETNILTLENATIRNGVPMDTGFEAGIYSEGDLNILLKGKNKIELKKSDGVGVTIFGNLSISGGNADESAYGSLNVTGCHGIMAFTNMVIENCKMNVTVEGQGICACDDLFLRNCNITASSKSDKSIINNGGELVIENCSIKASGKYGIGTAYGNITFIDSVVSAEGTEAGIVAVSNKIGSRNNGFIRIQSGTISAYGNSSAIIVLETNKDLPDDFHVDRTETPLNEFSEAKKPENAPVQHILLSENMEFKTPENTSAGITEWTYISDDHYLAVCGPVTKKIAVSKTGMIGGIEKRVIISEKNGTEEDKAVIEKLKNDQDYRAKSDSNKNFAMDILKDGLRGGLIGLVVFGVLYILKKKNLIK